MAHQILKIIIIFSLLSISQLTYASVINASCERLEKGGSFGPSWEERKYYLPDFMSVSGEASGYLPSEQVIIELNIETISDSAATSLLQNNQRISNAINEMKKAGVEQRELTTEDMKIYPYYRKEYDNRIHDYNLIFEGYKVEKKLKFISKKLDLAGKVIDIAINNGINKVSSVQFMPNQAKIKELKDSLLSWAVEDATKRANLALQPLNYEIKSVKSVDIENLSRRGQEQYSLLLLDPFEQQQELSQETQLFDNLKKFNIQVNVSFIIGRKESN